MYTNLLIIDFDRKWTPDYKYLDHKTKQVLINDGTSFDEFINKIFEVIEFDTNKFEATVWLNINLGTDKGIHVTKDEELTSCMMLLRNDPYYKGCKFVVDISEILSENFTRDQQQEVNAIIDIDNQQS